MSLEQKKPEQGSKVTSIESSPYFRKAYLLKKEFLGATGPAKILPFRPKAKPPTSRWGW